MWAPPRGDERVDEERFAELYERHAPAVHRYVRSRIRDPQLAEDTVQETFVRVYRFLDRLDPDRPSWPWVKAIASGMCSNAVRGRRHRAEVLVDDLAPVVDLRNPVSSSSILPEEQYLRVEERSRVRGVLGRLPHRHRTVLVLKEVDQLSCAEIASLEGSSSETVKAVLARARAAFRRAQAVPAALFLRRRRRSRLPDVRMAELVPVGVTERLLSGVGALVLAASTWGGASVTDRSVPELVSTSTVAMPAVPHPAAPRSSTSGRSTSQAGPNPSSPVKVTVAASTSVEVRADVVREVSNGEEMTLGGELWARLGTEEPYAGGGVDVQCDGEVRRTVCNVVASTP